MGCGIWVFTQPYMQWGPGDRLEPGMCLSSAQTKVLCENGTLVSIEEYKAPKKLGRPPKEVIETAEAPPAPERAALTSAPRPARLRNVETKTSKGEDDK